MISELIVATLVGVLWGWVWCAPEAHLLDFVKVPLNIRVNDYLEIHLISEDPPTLWFRFNEWISERLRCPVCMGADGSLVAIFMLRDFTLDWDAVPLLGASIGAHLVYQTILKKGDRNGY